METLKTVANFHITKQISFRLHNESFDLKLTSWVILSGKLKRWDIDMR